MGRCSELVDLSEVLFANERACYWKRIGLWRHAVLYLLDIFRRKRLYANLGHALEYWKEKSQQINTEIELEAKLKAEKSHGGVERGAHDYGAGPHTGGQEIRRGQREAQSSHGDMTWGTPGPSSGYEQVD